MNGWDDMKIGLWMTCLELFHCDDSDRDSVYSTDSNLILFAEEMTQSW